MAGRYDCASQAETVLQGSGARMTDRTAVSEVSFFEDFAAFHPREASDARLNGTNALPSQPVLNLEILEQCGVGPDAVAYRAIRPVEGDVVEVRVLSGAVKQADRWNALLKRLRLVQLAANPGVTRILLTQLETQPPRIVFEKCGEISLSHALRGLTPAQYAVRLALAEQIAATMAAAHTVGLVHGGFSLQSVRLRNDRSVQVDFSGIDAAGSAADPADTLCRSPEQQSGTTADAAADVFASHRPSRGPGRTERRAIVARWGLGPCANVGREPASAGGSPSVGKTAPGSSWFRPVDASFRTRNRPARQRTCRRDAKSSSRGEHVL